MNNPLVSITSAFYNTGTIILDMVRSVFAQTFKDWELILLDDGSTDNTLAIVKQIDDPRIRIESNKRNMGAAVSLNRLTCLARGKYIARMDSDDMCSPLRIQKQLEVIESDANTDVVGTGILYLNSDVQPVGYALPPFEHNEICCEPYRCIHICHGSLLAKKEWFLKNKYNEKLSRSIDYELFLRTYMNSKFANVQEPLYFYRLEQSYSLKKQFKSRLLSANFILKHYKDNLHSPVKGLCYSFMQFAKLMTEAGLITIGAKQRLLSRRFVPLNSENKINFKGQIDKILKTPV
jgi:glycosyltransferase involved in cell wall biosynthesis